MIQSMLVALSLIKRTWKRNLQGEFEKLEILRGFCGVIELADNSLTPHKEDFE